MRSVKKSPGRSFMTASYSAVALRKASALLETSACIW
jgi:hypothetical protein